MRTITRITVLTMIAAILFGCQTPVKNSPEEHVSTFFKDLFTFSK